MTDNYNIETKNSKLDTFQSMLSTAGFVPGYGEPADLANGIISLIRGDKEDALLSFASTLPLFGYAAGLTKKVKKLNKPSIKLDKDARIIQNKEKTKLFDDAESEMSQDLFDHFEANPTDIESEVDIISRAFRTLDKIRKSKTLQNVKDVFDQFD
tara:strand:+ start:262 stop:726 length:465 start_codon:yes stop_codon:yes gene_type:complete